MKTFCHTYLPLFKLCFLSVTLQILDLMNIQFNENVNNLSVSKYGISKHYTNSIVWLQLIVH